MTDWDELDRRIEEGKRAYVAEQAAKIAAVHERQARWREEHRADWQQEQDDIGAHILDLEDQ